MPSKAHQHCAWCLLCPDAHAPQTCLWKSTSIHFEKWPKMVHHEMAGRVSFFLFLFHHSLFETEPIINATLFVRWTVCCTYAGNLRTANLFQATLDQVDHQTGEILSRVTKMKSVRVVVSSTQKKKHSSFNHVFLSFFLFICLLLIEICPFSYMVLSSNIIALC